jgi:MFS family permease
LILGAPIAAIFFILVPFVRENFVLIALAILGTNVGMALFRSPTIAYLGDLFEPAERSKANGVINLMGGVGGALALFGGGALYNLGVPLPFIAGAGVMLLAVLVVLLAVEEHIPAAKEESEDAKLGIWENIKLATKQGGRSGWFLLGAIFSWFVAWNAMEAFFTLYARNILGIEVGTGTQMLTAFAALLILFAIPSGLIATKFGRKPTILVGLAGMFAGLVLGYFIRDTTPLLITLAVMGIFWAFININSFPMVYDLGGKEFIGAYTGLYYFAASAAAITGPILAGQLIDLTDHSRIWIFSAVFILIAGILLSQVKPRDQIQV